MKKSKLFNDPVPYDLCDPRSTKLVTVVSDGAGKSFVTEVCVEDVMSDIVPLNFEEVTLSSLKDKGVEPHSLDMIDSSKLGCDAGVEALAEHLTSHTSLYVESPKSELL